MILKILELLNSDNSRLFKERVLEEHLHNETLKKVLNYAYSPYKVYNIRKIPEYKKRSAGLIGLEQAMNELDDLVNRKYTGNEGIAHLKNILESVSERDAQVVERIIGKDLKCGVSTSTINKIFPGLVPTFDLMLCQPFNEKTIKAIKYPALSQLKADGTRIVCVVESSTNVRYFTRNGREIENLEWTIPYVQDFVGYVIDGEFVAEENGELLKRQAGNGLVQKALKGTASEEEKTKIRFQAWDLIGIKSFKEGYDKEKYVSRFNRLNEMIKDNKFLSIIPTRRVNSFEEAKEHFNEVYNQGFEGTVLKNEDQIYENKRVKGQVKLKAELECSLRIVDFEYGTPGSKYEKVLGSLVCESEDGKIKTHLSGFTDEFRNEFKIEDFKGKIVEVVYNEAISTKTGSWSLFLPRFKSIREDRSTADKFEHIVKEKKVK
jgi:hypothetical protein